MWIYRIAAAAAAALTLTAAPAQAQVSGKKVLFVNSYHEGYEWSDGIERAARATLQAAGAQVRFFRMDTKRHQDEAFRKQAGEKAKAEIDAFKPDAVILSDDMAVKYVLVPFYKGSAIPFVFCGVNWDATKYGFPMKNATGMVEVALVKNLIDALADYGKGRRIGFLTADNETEHIDAPYYKKQLGIEFTSERFVKTFAEWKAAFAKMQGEVDILFLSTNAGIADWSDKEAADFASANAKVVSGTIYDFMMPYAMLGYAKVAEEQGAWAAKAALEVLQGKEPGSIAITPNKQAKILINPRLAAKAGVIFKPELVRNAQVAAK